MTTYYKAVRLDGTDFATGTTRPVVGEWMPLIKGELVMCRLGYHVADTPGETLVGGWWPCRLFEVEIPEGDWEREQHKLVVSTYRPIRELSSWMALGPNGQEVAAFIERCQTLTTDDLVRLSAAWKTMWNDDVLWAGWEASHDAAWRGARDFARAAAWFAAWKASWQGVPDEAWNGIPDEAWPAARDAARDAALGLLVRDLITPEQFEILYGPWASVMEEARRAGPETQ